MYRLVLKSNTMLYKNVNLFTIRGKPSFIGMSDKCIPRKYSSQIMKMNRKMNVYFTVIYLMTMQLEHIKRRLTE